MQPPFSSFIPFFSQFLKIFAEHRRQKQKNPAIFSENPLTSLPFLCFFMYNVSWRHRNTVPAASGHHQNFFPHPAPAETLAGQAIKNIDERK